MSDVRNDDLKTGTFDTWAVIEAKRAAAVKTVQVKVDHQAATRQAIIVSLRREGYTVETRAQWKAKEPPGSPKRDWDYHGIAIHHAGNSFSCEADSAEQLRKAERIDFEKFGHLSYHYAIGCDGLIYEALDIRNKGAHIAVGNTGVIGIVMLADLSVHGEAYKEEYQEKSLLGKVRGVFDWAPDKVDVVTDEPPEVQIKALFALVKTLRTYFPIATLGGHREYQRLATHEGRACPGAYGMILVNMLRNDLKLEGPK
jgi:N-acetyl-anhydromuramyl-L-alanine amidase AmpD